MINKSKIFLFVLFIFLIVTVGAVSATNDAVEMSTVGLNDDCVDVNVYNNINASQIQSSDVSSNSDALKSVVNNNESSFGENLSGVKKLVIKDFNELKEISGLSKMTEITDLQITHTQFSDLIQLILLF